MLVAFEDFAAPRPHDICVVGAGPIGLALALACAKRGLRVLILESGLEHPSQFHIDLGRAAELDERVHTPLHEANCRALGGTSHWWGGRCVPFDAIDFEPRSWVDNSGWPITDRDVAPWYAEAARFFKCGSAEFSAPSPWPNLVDLQFDRVERWAPNPNTGQEYREALASDPAIELVLGATVTELQLSADLGRVVSLTASDLSKCVTIASPLIVLACGGLQTQRLLLVAQRAHPGLFGGWDGPLGRYYMGHMFGKIADLVLEDPQQGARLDFFLDGGAYARRRFTLPEASQRRHGLLQMSFSAGNAAIHDPSHRNGSLSLIWLALVSPLGKRLLPDALRRIYLGEGKRHYAAHVGNVVRTLIPTVVEGVKIARDKYWKRPGKPAVFLWSRAGRYALHYHCEQTPNPSNRVYLTNSIDALGMPRLGIALAFAEADAANIVRAHGVLDAALRANRIGRLAYRGGAGELVGSVLSQARDGMHQIGATRMAEDASAGVVDTNCRVHGLDNLFIASTSVFATSGQANPTFLGVALALRLAAHLASAEVGRSHSLASA